MEKWFIALVIGSIVVIAIVVAVVHFGSQPPEQYSLVLQHQWSTPPMTSTTANFTITGRQWFIERRFVSYSSVSSSMDILVQNASTNALVENVTLTDEQPRAYVAVKGNFYLSIRMNNATDLGQQLVLVNIWELR